RDKLVTGVQTCALPISGQQRLKVHTAKLRTLIDHQFLGKSPVAPNAEPKGHHGGTIAWGVKGHVASQDSSTVGIGHEGGPRSGEIGRASCRERVEVGGG